MVKHDPEKNTTELHERRTPIPDLKRSYEDCVVER
jgi:hypothetical protein